MSFVDQNKALVENDTLKIYLVDTDIMYIKYNEGVEIQLDDIQLIEFTYENQLHKTITKVIQDLPYGITMTAEARKYAAENSPPLKAVAYVIKGVGHRLLVRFYTKMRKIDKPTKFFEKIEDALAWLRTM